MHEVVIDGVKYIPEMKKEKARREMSDYEMAKEIHRLVWEELRNIDQSLRGPLLALTYDLKQRLKKKDC